MPGLTDQTGSLGTDIDYMITFTTAPCPCILYKVNNNYTTGNRTLRLPNIAKADYSLDVYLIDADGIAENLKTYTIQTNQRNDATLAATD